MRLVSLLILSVLAVAAHAQKQNNNWCFGQKAGVTFNTTPPSGIPSNMQTLEPQATVSNRHTGKLLFYTNGYTIWDGSHNIMQNGTAISTDSAIQSASQGVVIVPSLSDTNQYYVFSLAAVGKNAGNLYYSTVDMTLNSGLGAVVGGEKRVLKDTSFTEGMVTIAGCGRVWLVVQKRNTGNFYAYPITEGGIGAPYVSQVNLPRAPKGMSRFRASPDGAVLMDIGNLFAPVAHLVMHQFDKATGRVYGTRVLEVDDAEEYQDMEFSPDGSRLYIAAGFRGVYQLDMTRPNALAIRNSMTPVVQNATSFFTGVSLAADDNLYAVRNGNNYLDHITSPNALAPGCTYQYNVVKFTGSAKYNLPAKVLYPLAYSVNTSSVQDKVLCNGGALLLEPATQGDEYTWQDGSTDHDLQVSAGGTYYVEVKDNKDCKITVDSFLVEEVSVSAAITGDTLMCAADTQVLTGSSTPTAASLTWSNGSMGTTTSITGPGSYTLAANYKGCADTAVINVERYPLAAIELGNDTTLCTGNKLRLPFLLKSTIYDSYTWQDGSTADSFIARGPGWYHVYLTNQCQSLADSIYITERNCHFFFPSAFTPNGDGLNDLARLVGDIGVVADYALKIYNRWGELVFSTTNPALGWDGVYKGRHADIGTYYYQVRFTYLGEGQFMKGSLQLVR